MPPENAPQSQLTPEKPPEKLVKIGSQRPAITGARRALFPVEEEVKKAPQFDAQDLLRQLLYHAQDIKLALITLLLFSPEVYRFVFRLFKCQAPLGPSEQLIKTTVREYVPEEVDDLRLTNLAIVTLLINDMRKHPATPLGDAYALTCLARDFSSGSAYQELSQRVLDRVIVPNNISVVSPKDLLDYLQKFSQGLLQQRAPSFELLIYLRLFEVHMLRMIYSEQKEERQKARRLITAYHEKGNLIQSNSDFDLPITRAFNTLMEHLETVKSAVGAHAQEMVAFVHKELSCFNTICVEWAAAETFRDSQLPPLRCLSI